MITSKFSIENHVSPDNTVKIRQKSYTNHKISSLLPRNSWKLLDAFADLCANMSQSCRKHGSVCCPACFDCRGVCINTVGQMTQILSTITVWQPTTVPRLKIAFYPKTDTGKCLLCVY